MRPIFQLHCLEWQASLNATEECFFLDTFMLHLNLYGCALCACTRQEYKKHLIVRALHPANISTPSRVLSAEDSRDATTVKCHAEGRPASTHNLWASSLCDALCMYIYIYMRVCKKKTLIYIFSAWCRQRNYWTTCLCFALAFAFALAWVLPVFFFTRDLNMSWAMKRVRIIYTYVCTYVCICLLQALGMDIISEITDHMWNFSGLTYKMWW